MVKEKSYMKKAEYQVEKSVDWCAPLINGQFVEVEDIG